MADYLALDAATVGRHIDALLSTYPELAEDDALRADMIEGSTDLHRVIARALDHKLEAKTMVAAIKARSSDLSERATRWDRRDDAMGTLIKGLMEAAGLPKLVLPEATISITKGREMVDITDLAALPQGTFTTVRQPDKKAIKASLDAGDEVPGAVLVTSDTGLTVRTK